MTWTRAWLRSSSRLVSDECSNSPRSTVTPARFPQLETPGREPYAEYPDDLEDRVLKLRQRFDAGTVAIAHVLRARDDLSIANNCVHEILKENEHVTDNPNKQGRRHPWVRFERKYAGVTVHMDWYHNDRDDQVLAVEDEASRRVFDMIETDGSSAQDSVELLDSVCQNWDSSVPILEVITDHGSEFINTHQDKRPYLDHESNAIFTTTTSSTASAKLGDHNQTGKLSASSRPTRNTDGGSEFSTSSSPSTTRSGRT